MRLLKVTMILMLAAVVLFDAAVFLGTPETGPVTVEFAPAVIPAASGQTTSDQHYILMCNDAEEVETVAVYLYKIANTATPQTNTVVMIEPNELNATDGCAAGPPGLFAWNDQAYHGQIYEAGLFGSVKDFFTLKVLAGILSALVGIMMTMFGSLSGKITKTCVEGGEFLNVLGRALQDSKITREELGAIVKEGKDVFAVWST